MNKKDIKALIPLGLWVGVLVISLVHDTMHVNRNKRKMDKAFEHTMKIVKDIENIDDKIEKDLINAEFISIMTEEFH